MNPLESIVPGLRGEERVQVSPELTVRHFKPGMPAVYGTPMMIYLMESASAAAVHPHLPAGWVTVGSEVNVRHLAATPVGRTVTATAVVTAVDGRSIKFTVEAHDGVRKIGEGTHTRGAIDLARFEQRLAQSVDKE